MRTRVEQASTTLETHPCTHICSRPTLLRDGRQPYGSWPLKELRQHVHAWRRLTCWTNRRFTSHGLLLSLRVAHDFYTIFHNPRQTGHGVPLHIALVFHSIGVLIIYSFPSRGVLAICHLASSLHQLGLLDDGNNFDCEQSAPTLWACATPVAFCILYPMSHATGSDIVFLQRH